ncbi:MAG: outer membrane beta-barrel protein [Prevotella sp.]|nr:outer membrane beta-barrel protein [Prevotella sp.]MDY5258640.1 outer membrane beta-barrel protein [Prevotella sp.]
MKSLAFFTLLSALALPSQAQEQFSRSGKFSFIPQVGVSLAKFSEHTLFYSNGSQSGPIDDRFKAGFLAGAELMYNTSNDLAFTLGCFYVQAGNHYLDHEEGDGSTGEGITSNNVTIGQISVPLMVNYYLVPGLAVKGGVELNFNTSATWKYSYSNFTVDDAGVRTYQPPVDVKQNDLHANDFTVSIPLGLSFEYENVVIDARYHFPLSKAFKHNDDVSKAWGNAKNMLVTITAGYRFEF